MADPEKLWVIFESPLALEVIQLSRLKLFTILREGEVPTEPLALLEYQKTITLFETKLGLKTENQV